MFFTGKVIYDVLFGFVEETFLDSWIEDLEELEEQQGIVIALNKLDNYDNIDLEMIDKQLKAG